LGEGCLKWMECKIEASGLRDSDNRLMAGRALYIDTGKSVSYTPNLVLDVGTKAHGPDASTRNGLQSVTSVVR